MIHSPVKIDDLELSFSHKICFANFNHHIHYGDRIAIIGRNGSGKSSLIKILYGISPPSSGNIVMPDNAHMGYVPQIIDEFDNLSGGQRFNKALTATLVQKPNILLLDEPTNHLDNSNRKSLIRLLENYPATLIIVSHDTEFLRQCTDILWHIDQGQVHVFTGHYDDYICGITAKRASIERELLRLKQFKKEIHNNLMQEQQRARKTKQSGQKNADQGKWPTMVKHTKAGRAEQTTGRKKLAIDTKKQQLNQQLDDLYLPEIIEPKFSLTSARTGHTTVLSISDASVGYNLARPIVSHIYLSLMTGERMALIGDNGCGKSTIVKGIIGDAQVIKTGTWHMPHAHDMGYLDQQYGTLPTNLTVIESLTKLMPHWPYSEVRMFLNDFLFRKNEEVNRPIHQLSGGEKARLSLALIAAKPPKLLILDEITNNIDLETRDHIINVLKNYPGALLVISHDTHFLQQIDIIDQYKISQGSIFKTDQL